MPNSITDPILSKWNEQYKSLMRLPLFRIYITFTKFYTFKRNVSNICSTYIAEESSSYSNNMQDVCQAFNKMIENRNNMVNQANSVSINEYCVYLSYFLYDKIKNSFSSSNVQKFYEALNDTKAQYDLNDDKCTILKFNINEECFNKKKELFFRSDILLWIEKEYNNLFVGNYDFFNQYIPECANFYNGIILGDFCKNRTLYEPELKKFYDAFNKTKDFLKGKGVTSVDNITLIEKPECLSEVGNSILSEKELLVPKADHQMVDISDQLSDSFVPKNSSNIGTHTSEGIILGITFGTFLLFLSFYKFTPFGTWLHDKIRKKKKKYNLADKNSELLLDGSDNEDIKLYSELYPIRYNSA
ncbi:PIR protein [Plasmodium ovale]|uniref:PIR Superfamily Protein n=2 Tax=Plasmodium ovale TaxID=36330 RepID=A0A1A8X4L9_PLAOA|nr:PIR Superfamily Protein [Plasmodium ovale curtisi]SBT00186.1 PIR Superfamily Protein [Plasmodium ovale curtisi]SBT83696.1 PIR protein [Plasmodium ovale]